MTDSERKVNFYLGKRCQVLREKLTVREKVPGTERKVDSERKGVRYIEGK